MVLRIFFALTASLVFCGSALAADPVAPPSLEQSAHIQGHGVEALAGKRVMILGDSITQNGTYVSYLEYFLQKSYPQQCFDIVSVGLASETTSGLSEPGHAGGAFPRPCVHERLQRALDAVKPQMVVACYGMNDGIYKPYSDDIMKAFQDGVTKLVAVCQVAGAEVILVTPPVFEGGAYNELLAKFAAWEVAQPPKGVVAVADLHTVMAAVGAARQKIDPKFRFTSDNVHPGELGHVVMAQAILQELFIPMCMGGVQSMTGETNLNHPLEKGNPETLMAMAHADPLFKIVNQRRNLRSNGWLNYIGYTREKHVAPKTGDIGKLEAAAQELQSTIDMMKKNTSTK